MWVSFNSPGAGLQLGVSVIHVGPAYEIDRKITNYLGRVPSPHCFSFVINFDAGFCALLFGITGSAFCVSLKALFCLIFPFFLICLLQVMWPTTIKWSALWLSFSSYFVVGISAFTCQQTAAWLFWGNCRGLHICLHKAAGWSCLSLDFGVSSHPPTLFIDFSTLLVFFYFCTVFEKLLNNKFLILYFVKNEIWKQIATFHFSPPHL